MAHGPALGAHGESLLNKNTQVTSVSVLGYLSLSWCVPLSSHSQVMCFPKRKLTGFSGDGFYRVIRF